MTEKRGRERENKGDLGSPGDRKECTLRNKMTQETFKDQSFRVKEFRIKAISKKTCIWSSCLGGSLKKRAKKK